MKERRRSSLRRRIPRQFQRLFFSRPEVIVDFEFRRGLFFVSIRNAGSRPAINVRINFSPAFTGCGGEKAVTELSLFRDLTYLAPDRRIETFVDTSASYFARKQPTRIKVGVEYRDPQGTPYAERFEHNLEIYREIGYVDVRTRQIST